MLQHNQNNVTNDITDVTNATNVTNVNATNTTTNVTNVTSVTAACPITESSKYWWSQHKSIMNETTENRSVIDPVILSEFREYYGLNETHSFGKKCHDNKQEICLAVHIRSGDVFKGSYDETGHWVSGRNNRD